MSEIRMLICGQRSFVATGFADKLNKYSIPYECFSRGCEKKEGNIITGNVMNMASNPYLGNYDTVINFIILKDESVEKNVDYLKSLLSFCREKGVKHLIHISSISVYPNDAEYVNETSDIEHNYTNKGRYASIKVATDQYLKQHCVQGLTISLVRPGFIYTSHMVASKAGLLLSKWGINILLGNKKTSLPLIHRNKVHEALIKIIQSPIKENVYLLLDKDKERGTKYNYVCNQWNIKPICLPYTPIVILAKALKSLHVIKDSHYSKIKGLFKRTWFDSSYTEEKLSISFSSKRYAIIGAGTYGSYVANLLSIIHPHDEIDLYDVGNEIIKDEDEIGYLSHIIHAPYQGLKKGRYFGYGGASSKWGGQLLTFSDNDFSNPSTFLNDIVKLNIQHKDTVLKKFNLKNNHKDIQIGNKLYIKTGVWLSYFHRNLFKHFKIDKNKRIQIKPQSRITRFFLKNKKVVGFEYIHNGIRTTVDHYDYYFLTAGAFESGRILLNSGITEGNKLSFSDHLSQRAFKVTSGPIIGKHDFTFKIDGTSLITKRIAGEIDGYSFYSQPICNENFPLFKDIKRLMFKHEFSLSLIGNILKNIPSAFFFMTDIVFKKKLYIHKNEFDLQIDIEIPHESGCISLNEKTDNYGEKSLSLDLKIHKKTGEIFTKARDCIKKYLDDNQVSYTELPFSTTAEKYEDVYHPFHIYSNFDNIDDYYSRFQNMIIFNTGILPRAGSINSTCTIFPLIEEFILNRMK